MRRQERDRVKQENGKDAIRLLNAFKDLGLLIVDLQSGPTVKPVAMASFVGPNLLPEQTTVYRPEDTYIDRARQIDRELFALTVIGAHPGVRELAQGIVGSAADLQSHLNQGGSHQPGETQELARATGGKLTEMQRRIEAELPK